MSQETGVNSHDEIVEPPCGFLVGFDVEIGGRIMASEAQAPLGSSVLHGFDYYWW